MNLLKGQFSSDGSRFDLDASHALPLSDTKAKWANRPVVLGIRPEHIRLSSREQGGVPLRVDTLEMLGLIIWHMAASVTRHWWYV